jgi:hypothetical protein
MEIRRIISPALVASLALPTVGAAGNIAAQAASGPRAGASAPRADSKAEQLAGASAV